MNRSAGMRSDAFVEEQRRAHGVTASAEAPKACCWRRVYLDLIGLNPTPAEIAAFEGGRFRGCL